MLWNSRFLNGVAAGMATGIAFVILFSTFPIAPYPGFRENFRPADPAQYPFIRIYVSGINESYAVGERIDFQVLQTGGGCAYPDSITVIKLDSESVIFAFNGSEASSLLFCPVIFDPTDTRMRWRSDDWTERPIVASEAGLYAVVVTHRYITVERNFSIVSGRDYVSTITMPGGFNSVGSMPFKPSDLTVVIGMNNTVKWINNDYYANILGREQGSVSLFGTDMDSVTLEPEDSFEFTFEHPGQYSYLGNDSRKGTITVLR